MRTVREARLFIKGYIRNGRRFPKGECQIRCHDAYNIPTDGTPNAYQAWLKSKHKFHDQWIPGAFAYWAKIVDGKPGPPGHVAICAVYKGIVFSTDTKFVNGKTVYAPGEGWGRIPLTGIHEIWPDHVFLGFSLDNDGMTPQSFPRIRRNYP